MLALILGRRRQGKSTLALALARAAKQSVIVFDPNDQFGELPAVSIDDLEDWITEKTADVRIVPLEPETDFVALMDTLDGGVWRYQDYSLVIDEVSVLMRPASINPTLERLIRQAPKDLRIVLTTHRPVDVHPLIRSLSTDVFLFQQHLERDLKYIADNFGGEVSEVAANLQQYHLIHWWIAAGGKVEWMVWDEPARWYVDIGRRT